MRRWRRRLGAAMLLLAGLAGPGAAGEAGEASLTRVFTPECAVEFASAAFTDEGSGFVETNGDGCDPDERVWFIQDSGEVTPYRGVVLAAAEDEDSGETWLLYQGLSGVFLGRRDPAGVYERPEVVSTFSRAQVILPAGDLVVEGGRWWAVWSEQVGPADAPPQAEVFEAGTLAGEPAERRAVTAHPADDVEPALAFEPERGELTLAWVRKGQGEGAGALGTELRVGRSRPGEAWSSRVVSLPGTRNLSPALALDPDGGGAVLAWQQDLRVVLSVGGADPEAVLYGAGVRPLLTVAEGGVRVGWTEPGVRGEAMVAERRGGAWAEMVIAPDVAADQTLVGLKEDRRGEGTALVLTKRGELYAATPPERGVR